MPFFGRRKSEKPEKAREQDKCKLDDKTLCPYFVGLGADSDHDVNRSILCNESGPTRSRYIGDAQRCLKDKRERFDKQRK